jgi:hypothetical protein
MNRPPTGLAFLVSLAVLVLGTAPSRAGPLEARAAWERAQALRAGPWRARVVALRAVRAETGPSDSLYTRALAAEARALRDVQRLHGAAALEARAAALGPARDPERAARLLTQARALLSEEDRAAAHAPLLAAAEVARHEAPWHADEALEALGRLAAEDGDLAALRLLTARAEREQARPSTQIALWGALGLATLGAGSRAEAESCLARAERAFRRAVRADSREAARAAKTWLDLPLRARLAAR